MNRKACGRRAVVLAMCTMGIGMGAAARGAVTVDGTLNEADYGSPAPGAGALATQTINTSFGNSTAGDGTSLNGSELDAAYGVVENGNLYLFIAGNLQNNGNFINIFLADGRTGQSTLSAKTGAGSMNQMNGSVFPANFSATYALEMNISGGSLFVDQFDLIANTATFIGQVGLTGGIGNNQNVTGLAVGMNNLNAAGVSGSSAGTAADQAAAQAVGTGIELAIPLARLGNPTSAIKVLMDINGGSDSGPSNQFLPGLQVGTPSIKTGPNSATNPYFLSAKTFTFQGPNGQFPNQFLSVPVPMANGIWLPTGSGSWGTPENWTNNAIPSTAADTASFSSAAGDSSVTLDGNRTVNSVSFNSLFHYSIDPGTGGSLVMDNGANGATITDFGGVHTITADVVLNSTTTVTAQNHGDAITISGNISGVGGLTVANSGIAPGTHSTLALSGNNSWQGPTVISRGELQLNSATALPAGTSLSMSSSSPHAVLDLNGYGVVVSTLAATGAASTNNPLATITTSNTTAGAVTFTYAGTMANPSTFKGTFSDSATAGGSSLALLVSSGSLTLNGNNTYTGGTKISSGATATFASVLTDGTTHALTGSALPINSSVANDGALIVGASATANAISGTGSTSVTAGTLAAMTINQASLTIANDSSRVLLAQNGSNSVHVSALAVGDNSSSANAQLDLNDNDLALAYSGTSPVDAIRNLLIEGRNGGGWDGNGIASLAAHNDGNQLTGLGYADTGSEVDVKYTYYGDSSLDGKVDLGNDFNLFIQGFLGGGSTWLAGDYNYDGLVDTSDFEKFVDGFAAQGSPLGALDGIIEGSSLLTMAQKAQLLAAVPEPGSVVAVGMMVCGMGMRRRRSR